jgi:molecular chaperone GrpE
MSDRDAEGGVGTEQVEDAVLEEGEGAEPEPEQEAIEEGEPSLEEVLAKVREEAAAHYDRYLRTAAELDNFRKRTARMRSEVREDTLRDMLLQIAPGLDNMRRALDQDTDDIQALKQGIELIYSQLNGALEGYGLKLIDAVDQTFDPNIHEAMVEVEDAERAPGTVIEEMEKGYTLNGKVVRPARVIVSKAPSEGE